MAKSKSLNILDIRFNKEIDKKTAEHFLSFSFGNLNLGNCITQILPRLELALSLKPAKKRRMISQEVDSFYTTYEEELEEKRKEIEQLWAKNEKKFDKFLDKIAGEPFPKGKITLYLSIFDSGNNFLDNKSFQVWAGKNPEEMISSIVFELLCFYFDKYAKKHLKNFSDDERWHLTEQFAGTFVRSNAFVKIFCFEPQADIPGFGQLAPFRNVEDFIKDLEDYHCHTQ
jgi:phenylalanyl-tRNA synthetase alpha subunit